MSRPTAACRYRPGAGLLLLLLLGACGEGVLAPEGPVGAAQRTILFNSLAIMLAIVIPTIGATIGFAWWFRASNTKATYRPDWAYSGRIELIVWSIPLLVILFLSGVIWVGSHRLDPFRPLDSKARPLEVQVVSLDWKWLFIYPEQRVASVNRLVLPVGRPVHFRLTSASVMNTFFIPRLGGMIYTMNGMTMQLHLQADKPGRYYGQSGHYSGDGFSDMNFAADAVPPAQFAGWVSETRAIRRPLDARSYTILSRQSQDVRPFTFSIVQPGLFDAVVAQRLAPGPGPDKGRGGPTVSPGEG